MLPKLTLPSPPAKPPALPSAMGYYIATHIRSDNRKFAVVSWGGKQGMVAVFLDSMTYTDQEHFKNYHWEPISADRVSIEVSP